MTKSPEPAGNPRQDDWNKRLDRENSADDLVAALSELANQEDVPGVTRLCLELLGHADSQVRVWAAEAVESSVAPAGDETESLIQWLGKLLDRQTESARKSFVWPGTQGPSTQGPSTQGQGTQANPSKIAADELAESLLADQLYWTATMIGRIGPAAAAADALLARLEALQATSSARPFHDAAARAARMRHRIQK